MVNFCKVIPGIKTAGQTLVKKLGPNGKEVIVKNLKGGPKAGEYVDIVMDDISKIPGRLYLNTGTKVFPDFGMGCRVLQPGADTKLGKLGVETVTTYPKGFYGDEALISLQFKGAKSPMPLQTPQEVKSTLEFVKKMLEFEKAQKNPVNRVINTIKNAMSI